MRYDEFLEKKIKEKLEADKEYQNLIDLKLKKSELETKHALMFKVAMFTYRSSTEYHNDIYYGLIGFKDAYQFVNAGFEADKAVLKAKRDKSIFRKKKYQKELDYLRKKYKFAEEAVKLDCSYSETKLKYNAAGGYTRQIEIEKRVAEEVVLENQNSPELQEAFLLSISKDGHAFSYQGESCDDALEYIDKKVQNMLAKTKYKEKLDDLKSQFSEDETEKE